MGDPDNTILESNETNNRYPASGTITLTFRPRQTMKIVGQRLRYHPSSYSGEQYAGGWAVNGGAADWFEQLLSVRNNAVNYQLASGYLNWTTSLGSGDGQHALIKTLNAQWILVNVFAWMFSGDFTNATHVYGFAPNAGYSGGHADMPVYPHAGGLGVTGIGTDRPGTNTDNPGGGALIFGHELIHNYNLLHTNTADSCGSNDSSSNFPYSSSSIQEYGFNPITGKIYNPSNTHDVMSYCPAGGSKEGWISPFTWNAMYNKLAPGLLLADGQDETQDLANEAAIEETAAPLTSILPETSLESLVVNATIFNPDYKPAVPGKLGALYRISGGLSTLQAQGNYAIQLLDEKGQTLATYPFVVNFESEYDAHSGGGDHPETAPPFPPEPTLENNVSFVVPWVVGVQSIALVQGNVILDVRAVSSNAPTIQITNPTAPVNWPAGATRTLAWSASDADGDPLVYSVFYSHDGGASWELVADGLSAQSYNVVVDTMAGGSDVRFRVLVTDGVNTAFDETDANITIPNHAPFTTILSPLDGKVYTPGALVVLSGSGLDMEDGTLPNNGLAWSSDVQGGLGIGPSVPLNVLTPGWHTITLTATDSYGVSASSSVKIFIGYTIHLPLARR